MQELTFEQVGIVVGGNGGEGSDSGSSDAVETDTIKVKQDASGLTISCCSHNIGPISISAPVFSFNYSTYLNQVAARPLPSASELNSAVENGMMHGSML